MHFGGARQIETSANIVRHDYPRIGSDRTCDLKPLPVPAGKRRRGNSRPGGADAESAQKPRAQLHRLLAVEPGPPGRPLPERTREHQVLPERHVHDEPDQVAVLGNDGQRLDTPRREHPDVS